MIGTRVGRLIVGGVERKGRHLAYRCRCDCGNEKIIRACSLRDGCTRSCGCLASERITQANTTHGRSQSHEWVVWRSMRQRCEDPKHRSYRDYGGRGIYVCERWQKFEQFLADMGDCPSPDYQIDRINNDGSYTPDNCRWATRSEQARNRRPRRKLPPTPSGAAGGLVLPQCGHGSWQAPVSDGAEVSVVIEDGAVVGAAPEASW